MDNPRESAVPHPIGYEAERAKPTRIIPDARPAEPLRKVKEDRGRVERRSFAFVYYFHVRPGRQNGRSVVDDENLIVLHAAFPNGAEPSCVPCLPSFQIRSIGRAEDQGRHNARPIKRAGRGSYFTSASFVCESNWGFGDGSRRDFALDPFRPIETPRPAAHQSLLRGATESVNLTRRERKSGCPSMVGYVCSSQRRSQARGFV